MIQTAILLALVLVLLLVIVMLLQFRGASQATRDVSRQLDYAETARKETAQKLLADLSQNRSEAQQSAKDLRMEMMQQVNLLGKTLSETVHNASEMQYKQLHQFSELLYQLTNANTERFAVFQKNIDSHHAESRKELKLQLEVFQSELHGALNLYKDKLRENFSDFEKNQHLSHQHTGEKLSDIKKALETSINAMQQSNEKRLEDMRRTVDEKLNETLERRLGESFKLVSERLEAVHKGLGDMQSLALSVGDLKKVMSNVKSRGVLGEYQLQNILEDLLTQEQYGRNVKTKTGSGAIVEFAIKMPHGNNLDKTLWMPVDAKFPREDYELLLLAYDEGSSEQVELARKAFANSIRKNAQDIRDKYIDPPNTTEYGIMFLPFESLYAEVLRVPGLFEKLQKDYKITITGPTTLSALLNSLQMGFRTLAIEKRSTEVWDLLHIVKNEFNQFGILLDKTKKKLDEASNVIEQAGTRTRVIQRKLDRVAWVADTEPENLLVNKSENETEI